MILGIGTDILKIQRILDVSGNADDPFFRNTYTAKEQEEAEGRHNPALYYATRFAGKEAVFKCLGVDGKDIKLNEIEILGSEIGQPYVVLSGNAQAAATKKGIRNIAISLSYDNDYAIGFAVAEN
jgi:holo-[acyl-carrier protein] synthase